MRAERITDVVTYHGEGPVWSERWGGLRCVDMLAGDVLSLGPGGEIERRHVGRIAAALRPRRGGGAVIGVERGFALEDADGTLTTLPEVWSDPGVRMNEGACDPDGRFWCGSMAYDKRPGAAAMYRLDPDRSAARMFEDLTISNGLCWTPDGAAALYVDTATQRIDRFDYDAEHGLSGRRPFAAVPEEAGHPDGLTVDAHGGAWVALYGGGAVRHYGPDGTLEDVVEVGARQVTACTFGGPELRELYITTSREDLEEGEDPQAGSLFRVEPGVAGFPTLEFAG